MTKPAKIASLCLCFMLIPACLSAASSLTFRNEQLPDTIPLEGPTKQGSAVAVDSVEYTPDGAWLLSADTVAIITTPQARDMGARGTAVRIFNPDPTRAVWLSALCPGLGQIYNRRYWKLPLIVGGFMGLAYGTSWNNEMLTDYTRAYADIMDNDPTTKSYMDFFPITVKEEDLDKSWLTSTLKSRKDYYRRNRDLCIICMVGVYLLAMVDAYVDAQLAHFDISGDLSMDITPAIIPDAKSSRPGVGMTWAFTF